MTIIQSILEEHDKGNLPAKFLNDWSRFKDFMMVFVPKIGIFAPKIADDVIMTSFLAKAMADRNPQTKTLQSALV